MNELTQFKVEFSEFVDRLRGMRRWETVTHESIDHGRQLEAGFWVSSADGGLRGYVFRASFGRWPGPLTEEGWREVERIINDEELIVPLRELTDTTPRFDISSKIWRPALV